MESVNGKTFINKGDKSLSVKTLNGKTGDLLLYGLIGFATAFTVGVLLWILGFIFYNGMDRINLDFFLSDFDSKTSYVDVNQAPGGSQNKLGLILEVVEHDGGNWIAVKDIEDFSNAKKGTDPSGKHFSVKKGDLIKKVGKTDLKEVSLKEANDLINREGEIIRLKVTTRGEGVFPMVITTLMMIGLSLLIACPIGVFAAIYLTEYAKPGRLVRTIRFATESLAGIPSIIYGLFGMLFFVTMLKFNYSLLAGALTLSIVLLPVIIRQTEESLKAVPSSFREASLGLGATKIQTISKVVLPSAVPGIVVAIILSIGRIVGESAALLLTAGTVARIPNSLFVGGATLTVKAYNVAKEEGDIKMACAIGTVVIIVILILNVLSKVVSKRFSKI